jgi:hypothetical protein
MEDNKVKDDFCGVYKSFSSIAKRSRYDVLSEDIWYLLLKKVLNNFYK